MPRGKTQRSLDLIAASADILEEIQPATVFKGSPWGGMYHSPSRAMCLLRSRCPSLPGWLEA